MKHSYTFPAFLGLALIFASCQKELSYEIPQNGNNNNTSNNAVTGSLKMKVDGVQWVADRVAGASIISGIINVSGISKDGKTLTITLKDTVARTYVLQAMPPVDSLYAAAYSDSASRNGISYTTVGANSQSGGTVTVTGIDRVKKQITGTFQFTVIRAIDNAVHVISEGSFNLPYATTLPPTASTDTFHVKIDGTLWTPASVTGVLATVPGQSTQLIVEGNNSTASKTVALYMPGNVTAGTYTLDLLGLTYYGQYNADATTFLISQSGSMTILENNTATKRVRGNFNFTAGSLLGGSSSQLTEGYFSVHYQ